MESGALRDLNLPPLSPRFETPCPNLPFSPPPPPFLSCFCLTSLSGKIPGCTHHRNYRQLCKKKASLAGPISCVTHRTKYFCEKHECVLVARISLLFQLGIPAEQPARKGNERRPLGIFGTRWRGSTKRVAFLPHTVN